jgi:hypothetical protein
VHLGYGAGHSSGAHLSLPIATDPRYLFAHRMTPADIRAVIGLSTPVDLSRHADGHGYGDVLFSGHGADPFRRDEGLMEDASPIRHVSRGIPPLFSWLEEKTSQCSRATLARLRGKPRDSEIGCGWQSCQGKITSESLVG